MDREGLSQQVQALFAASIATKQKMVEDQSYSATLVAMAETMAACLKNGGKILMCGNGGSAADAQHLAAELLIRLRPQVNRQGIPALALATDTSSITACGNDYSFEAYFSRMTAALGRPGDVLLGISTSGKSPNVILALQEAKRLGMIPMGFLGGNGGPMLAHCQLALVVPSGVTGRVQEAHIMAGHALMELVEDLLLDAGYFTLPT
ncbi:MAG: D-sedoheptulose 7-phosphate isomerase [Magnetococcales bacterium]|nr:D-sedoheptulose 7-phosphate isomerase [Magnetococcales bacterium]